MKFRTECAWCGAFINETGCNEITAQMAMDNNTDVIISHGLCASCRKRIEKNEFKNQGDNEHD
ncbi:MAG: hypothetical protein PF503_16875 [Desulfobacula sp.]|jgi:hypothetical protein|nr:hypothetical protein [Desulfobacula sp.]